MSGGVEIAFERELVLIALSDTLPIRKLAPEVAAPKRYQRNAISSRVVDVIEPLAP